MPLHVSSTCAHHQEVKIVLHSLRYHQTYRCDETSWKLGAGSVLAPKFQPTATQEPDCPCGNQHYSRELLMMGITVPETC